jgi:hypothetical protein
MNDATLLAQMRALELVNVPEGGLASPPRGTPIFGRERTLPRARAVA